MLPWKLIPFPAFCPHTPGRSDCSLTGCCETPAMPSEASKTPKPGPEAFCEVPLTIYADSSRELMKCCNSLLISGTMSTPISVFSKGKHLSSKCPLPAEVKFMREGNRNKFSVIHGLRQSTTFTPFLRTLLQGILSKLRNKLNFRVERSRRKKRRVTNVKSSKLRPTNVILPQRKLCISYTDYLCNDLHSIG